MRGEELEGLSVDELHQMERKLEAGLHKVLSTKVGLTAHDVLHPSDSYLSCSSVDNCIFIHCMSLQDQLFMQQISELHQKVRNDYVNPVFFLNCSCQTHFHFNELVVSSLNQEGSTFFFCICNSTDFHVDIRNKV